MKLENIGNIRTDYKHEPRTVKPSGLITTPNLVLKLYDMLAEGEKNPLGEARSFINKEINEGKISPLTGLGFSILSRDMLNISRWDEKYPIVLRNQIYEFNPNISRGFDSAKLLSVDDFGSFCIWELGIVAHEKEGWKKYLDSQRTEKDKRNYLEDFLEGNL